MFVHTVIMVIEPHMKQGRQHKLISTIFLATSVTKKLDHNTHTGTSVSRRLSFRSSGVRSRNCFSKKKSLLQYARPTSAGIMLGISSFLGRSGFLISSSELISNSFSFFRRSAWHPRRSETRVNYRGSSHYEYKTIKKTIVKKYDCIFAYFCI